MPTAVADTRDDLGHDLGNHLADGDVVLQEEWLRAAHDQIVDTHRDEVLSDGVVLADRLGDGELRTDTVA